MPASWYLMYRGKSHNKNLNTWYMELQEFRPEILCIVVAKKIYADMKMAQ